MLCVVTLENDVQKQEKKAVMKIRAGPRLRSISEDLCGSAAWTHIFLNYDDDD